MAGQAADPGGLTAARLYVDAYNATNWTGLFGAEISASAALTGLIFVAVSINLQRILAFAALPGRVLKALFMLLDVLIVSTVVIVPGQSAQVLGTELLTLGLVGLASLARLDLTNWRLTERPYRPAMLRVNAVGFGSALATSVAGASLIAHDGGGLYWLVPAILLAFPAAVIDAWVLLIEIVR